MALEVEPGKVLMHVGVVANGKYANHLRDANGVRHGVSYSETIAAPRHEPPASLKAIVEGVHAELVMLRATEFKRIDLGVQNVNGAPNGKIGNVKDTSAAEFVAAVAAHIQFWEREDIDFQIKKATAPGADFNAATQEGSTVPGAFLGYYSAVDNDTLKRFGVERPDIRIISLRHSSITSAGLSHLKVLEQLEELDLAETAIDDAGLAHLQEIKSLRRVNVTGTRVSDAGIEKLKAAVPSLEINDVKQ